MIARNKEQKVRGGVKIFNSNAPQSGSTWWAYTRKHTGIWSHAISSHNTCRRGRGLFIALLYICRKLMLSSVSIIRISYLPFVVRIIRMDPSPSVLYYTAFLLPHYKSYTFSRCEAYTFASR